MDQNIRSVQYNWFYTEQLGEEYLIAKVGENNVIKIIYHEPIGDGDKHYCDIYYGDKRVARIFNINKIEY